MQPGPSPAQLQPDNQSAKESSSSSGTSSSSSTMPSLTIGVLALQGAFVEHIALLQRAAAALAQQKPSPLHNNDSTQAETQLHFIEVRTPAELAACTALILPGGESTAISLIAERCGLLQPLREFVKVQRKPVWGTCAGLILLAESANKSKATGQELIGGLDVRVQRNYFGRQVESFEAGLKLAFLEGQEPFHSVFIRAPVVEKVLSKEELAACTAGGAGGGERVVAPAMQATRAEVEILGRLPGRAKTIRDKTTTAEDLGEDGDIVAVRQGNVFGTSFHPELTGDERIHAWWLQEVIKASREQS